MHPGLSRMLGNLKVNHSLIEAVDIREFPIDLLLVLDLVHKAIIIDDEDDIATTKMGPMN
jgi:hypothetical protein